MPHILQGSEMSFQGWINYCAAPPPAPPPINGQIFNTLFWRLNVWTFSVGLNGTTTKEGRQLFLGKKVHRQRKSWLCVWEKGPRLTLVCGPRMVNLALWASLQFIAECNSEQKTEIGLPSPELLGRWNALSRLTELMKKGPDTPKASVSSVGKAVYYEIWQISEVFWQSAVNATPNDATISSGGRCGKVRTKTEVSREWEWAMEKMRICQ